MSEELIKQVKDSLRKAEHHTYMLRDDDISEIIGFITEEMALRIEKVKHRTVRSPISDKDSGINKGLDIAIKAIRGI